MYEADILLVAVFVKVHTICVGGTGAVWVANSCCCSIERFNTILHTQMLSVELGLI